MHVTKLTLKNIGIIADAEIKLDQPLILFYGEIKQGKSTILKAVRWLCGGEFPQDIIRHGEKEAHAELEFDGGLISRSWYRAKDDTTKSRPVIFVRNGKPVSSPVTEIKRLLNPFLLDQDFLRNKTELERKQFFSELFAVDTTELDTELFNNQRDAQDLRVTIKSYGEIDLTEIKPVDVSAEKSKLEQIRQDLEKESQRVNTANELARNHNTTVERVTEKKAGIVTQIAELEAKLKELNNQFEANAAWLRQNPVKVIETLVAPPDTSALETKIQEAGATNVRAEQFVKNKERAESKKSDEKKLAGLEKRGRDIKAEKQTKLKGISDTSGIKGLEFDDAGNFIYEGVTAGMISDSQIMKLSSELSALYPEGFGLDLIDRAESLGKSIFEFVDRAKAEKKTILATIVGERPAKVPPEIGVFVVDGGKVTQ